MKKIITNFLIFTIIFGLFGIFQNSYAEDYKDKNGNIWTTEAEMNESNEDIDFENGDEVGGGEGIIAVEVSEKIPGVACSPSENNPDLYTCTSERGFGAVMLAMGGILKYFTFLAGIFAVLSLVVGGIMYSMGGANESLKSSAKDYIKKSLFGLILLLLSGTILYMIAPWVYV